MTSTPALPALVLDTNCVLALWMFRDSGLAALRAHIENAHCRLYSRADALEELRRVLGYAQFGVNAETRDRLLAAYRRRSLEIPSPRADAPALPACSDADDQKFLEISRDASAQFLLTRDKALLRLGRHRLLRERFRILTPEAYQRHSVQDPPAA